MSVTIILQAPNTATITHTGAVSATITQSGAVSATIQQVVGQGVSVQNIVPNSVTINTGGASGGGTLDSVTSAGNTTANSIEVGSVTANGNFLINGLDSLVELRGTSVDFNIQTADAENIARIATTTGGSARFQLYNHTEGFEGAEEFKATTWEDDALVISGGIPTTTKLLVSRNPNEATLQVTGDASISGDIILTSPNDTAYRIVVGNDGTLAAIPPTSTAPSITTLPTISGTLNVGETLTATAGNVSGEPTPTRVLQWQRSDNGTTGWADISGATGTTYLLGSLDEDKYIRVVQTEENILGTATANSVSTTQIGPILYAYLLDDYSGASAAYSLRRLSSTYTGDAIVVRRASDNTTQSIGFVNNELDTASLESFCAGTDGFITTWYDQSGSGNHMTRVTAAFQPQIVSAGTSFGYIQNTTSVFLSSPLTLTTNSLYTYFGVVQSYGNAIYIPLVDASNNNQGFAAVAQSGSTSTSVSNFIEGNRYQNSSLIGATRADMYAATASFSAISAYVQKTGGDAFFASGTPISSYNEARLKEVILYPNQTIDRTGVENNIITHYGF